MNVCSTGYGCKSGDGALEGFGLCYGQAQPLFFAEYYGNNMVNSSGITLHDNVNPKCPGYGGPLVRWQVLRHNEIAGIAESSLYCGSINATSTQSTDVVSEANTFTCGGFLPSNGTHVDCDHCISR